VNEHEARARAVKSFKIARVLVRLCRRFPRYDDVSLADADEHVREAVAKLAGVNPPSDETWTQALELLRVWLGPSGELEAELERQLRAQREGRI
jgi:hypothetical protein